MLRKRRGGPETLRASSVSRSFEGVQALQDVSLELSRHEVVGLIGPNGAGKSTLVNVLTGFDFPDEGAVELGGQGDHRLELAPPRPGRSGADVPAQPVVSAASRCGRTSRWRRSASGAGPREARRRAEGLLELLGL